MGYYFSDKSKREMLTIHPELQLVCNRAIKIIDFAVVSGFRNQETQDLLYSLHRSERKWPDSKHNTMVDGVPCSDAMDLAFYKVDWGDREKWYYFAGIIMGVAGDIGFSLRWGGDWDRDDDLHDQTLFDFGHFERVT